MHKWVGCMPGSQHNAPHCSGCRLWSGACIPCAWLLNAYAGLLCMFRFSCFRSNGIQTGCRCYPWQLAMAFWRGQRRLGFAGFCHFRVVASVHASCLCCSLVWFQVAAWLIPFHGFLCGSLWAQKEYGHQLSCNSHPTVVHVTLPLYLLANSSSSSDWPVLTGWQLPLLPCLHACALLWRACGSVKHTCTAVHILCNTLEELLSLECLH